VGVLAASTEQAGMIGDLSGAAAELAARHWPGALTLVVRPKVILADWVGDRQRNTVGIRVPNHPVALALLELTGPLTVTSANPSGEPECLSDAEARAVFGDRVFYVPGTSPGGLPSTVLDLTGNHPVLLRAGPVEVGILRTSGS
jgi:tRNA threonylcarbamoyl adenosine modification protein (Sua5/YciO/YrdC/YwlC family)